MSIPDIGTVEGALAYLSRSPFDVESITKLGGGNTNHVYRLHLRTPYNGRRTLVLKHGKAQVLGNPPLHLQLERQIYEVNIMKKTKARLPDDSLVTVPTVHLFDEEAAVIIMDDCGETAKTLKQLVLDDDLDSVELANVIGTGLGCFLAQLHLWGKGNKEELQFFDGNSNARKISWWCTHGRLVETLVGPDPPAKLDNPLLDIPKETIERIQESVDIMYDKMLSSYEVLNVGDFWPGNIMVSFGETPEGRKRVERIHVFDWELVKPGIAAFDIGQFCSDIHQLRRFHPPSQEVATVVMNSFLNAYRREAPMELENTASVALVQLGAHLVVVPPRFNLGSKEKTREVVEEGIKLLLDGCEGPNNVYIEVANEPIGWCALSTASSPARRFIPRSVGNLECVGSDKPSDPQPIRRFEVLRMSALKPGLPNPAPLRTDQAGSVRLIDNSPPSSMPSNNKSDNNVQCSICRLFYHKKGYGSHRKKCELAEAARRRTDEFLSTLAVSQVAEREDTGIDIGPTSQSLDRQGEGTNPSPLIPPETMVDQGANEPEVISLDELDAFRHSPPIQDPYDESNGSQGATPAAFPNEEDTFGVPLKLNSQPPNPPPSNELQPDSILTDYHPSSGKPRNITPLQGHGRIVEPELEPEREPWKPFRTRLDFELAELALEAGLNKSQMARYISLIHQAIDVGKNTDCGFTITSQAEVETLWDLASKQRVKFQKSTIEVNYKGTPQEFTFQHRDPWEWILEMVRDARLAPNMAWEAQRIYRWDGSEFERFVDEPWTAEAFWQAQSVLPEGASPIALILYADKNKLSTFGTAKGHPIIARLGNLPAKIRNAEGLGGGRVVGWLPIVPEDTKETGKPAFVNFKNAVWHESFRKFLESLQDPACAGSWVTCGDDKMRWLWLIILIFSADYEENTTVSLTRGSKSKFPCPVCLVPNGEQTQITKLYPLRTQNQSQEIYNEAMSAPTKQEGESLLKKYSLRLVKNAFWSLPHSDIHRAISYDTLHSDENGLWEDHFFKQFKALISVRSDIVKIDEQFNNVPRWSGLNHFNSVMNISFNDGSKNHDIACTFLYASVCVLARDRTSEGYQLLKTHRHYLNVRMYAEFNLHTTLSISDGRQALQKFETEMQACNVWLLRWKTMLTTISAQEYIGLINPALTESISSGSSTSNPDADSEHDSEPESEMPQDDQEPDESPTNVKSWNFPKMHLRSHLFDDIVSKGVARNFSTKPNEKMHGPIRKYYQRRTNFKNFGDQILRADEFLVASTLIRCNLDYLDTWSAQQDEDASIIMSNHSHQLTAQTGRSSRASPRALVSPQGAGKSPSTLSSTAEAAEYDRLRKLGSRGDSITYQELENSNRTNVAYNRFRLRLNTWLTTFLRHYNILSSTDQCAVTFKATHSITTYQLLKVKYTCLSDWKEKTDMIRCNPNFHHAPRYDCVLVNSEDGPYFAKLLMLFTCEFQDQTYPIAFIQPFSAVYKHGNRPARDIDLELLRLRPMAANRSQFISIHSILRGAVVVPSGEEGIYSHDCFLYDLLDPDMFLRGRQELAIVASPSD